ncbi:hypothetical protein C8J57DRAFT_1595285 [Mycena rebaudengoi]|nr:hypothetical protein C8J57DRAFT_1595285 [Mycena rebaudengoi]
MIADWWWWLSEFRGPDRRFLVVDIRHFLLRHPLYAAFNLSKWIEKLLKIETALAVLIALAKSPIRGKILDRPLIVHFVPLDGLAPIKVPFSDFEQEWVEKVRTAEGKNEIALKRRIHSECGLVAWMATHPDHLSNVVPFITCSKLHCLACSIWLKQFNSSMPKVMFEGSHGTLQPGWWPPILDDDAELDLLNRMTADLNTFFSTAKHPKDGSASSTSSGPPLQSNVSSSEEHVEYYTGAAVRWLVSLCLLLEVHEELFPLLHAMLQMPEFVEGPLAFATADGSVDVPRLQRLLLTGMGEAEREKLERATLGDVRTVDCPLLDGMMDAWIMPALEVQHVQEMRNALLGTSPTFYEFGDEDKPEVLELSPRLENVHGILLLRAPGSNPAASPLISTPTTDRALRSLALNISLRLPTLLSSPPSSGKSLLLSHLAGLLYPGVKNQIIHIHLADTSLDPRSLLGSYVSSPKQPGTFEWKEGVLVRSMRQGRWVVFEDVDRGSSEVLGVIKPLVESLGLRKWIGQRASLEVPSRRRVVAADGLAGATAQALIRLWDAVRVLGSAASTCDVGFRELEKFCTRVDRLLPSSHDTMDVDSDANTSLSSLLPNPTLREGHLPRGPRYNIAILIAQHLGLEPERREWVLNGRTPELDIEKDVNGRTLAIRVGRTRLAARATQVEISVHVARPFAMHRPAVLLLLRIATAVSIGEPVLLTGETGTGKTSVVTHLAALLRRPLVSLSLSHQTESADLVGGFKPIDARIPGSILHDRFLELFGGTFSRWKNEKFEAEVWKAVAEGRWKRAVGLWKESTRLAKERIQAKGKGEDPSANADTPRKRRKVDHVLNVSEATWSAFERDVMEFEVQHVQAKGKFAFGFVEGPLVEALRSGDWVLLDEINLASAETLECISGLLHGPTASMTLTEQGSVTQASSHALGGNAAIRNVTQLSAILKQLAESRQIADGSNHRPQYSMRTLSWASHSRRIL